MSAKAIYIEYDQAQYISLNKLNLSANSFLGFLINAIAAIQGVIPNTKNKMIPGKRKFAKGECPKMDIGKLPINFPDGDIINNAPPPTALIPKNNSNAVSIFLAIVGFMINNSKS